MVNGIVNNGTLCINGYNVDYSYNKATVQGTCENPTQAPASASEISYVNSASKACTGDPSVSCALDELNQLLSL